LTGSAARHVQGPSRALAEGAYDDPALYDLLHTPGTAAELNGIERIARRFAPPSRRWLEPCCGTGRFLRLLARRGRVRCVGVELDPIVAEYANKRLARTDRSQIPRARALVGDIRSLDRLSFPRSLAPPFGFAFCPHNSIRHLTTPPDLTAHLCAVAAVLAPGGIYAVGTSLQPIDQAVVGEDVHTAKRGETRVTSTCQYFDAPRSSSGHRLERILTHNTVRVGRCSRLTESVYDLLCIDPAMWHRCTASAGLSEIAIVDDDRARDLPADRVDYAFRVLVKNEVHRAGGEARRIQRRIADDRA